MKVARRPIVLWCWECIVFLDQRTTSHYKLSTLCAILNNGLRKKFQLPQYPVRNIQVVDSKKNDLVQIADILMGAIGYEMNGMHMQSGAKRSKVLLAEYIRHYHDLIWR